MNVTATDLLLIIGQKQVELELAGKLISELRASIADLEQKLAEKDVPNQETSK